MSLIESCRKSCIDPREPRSRCREVRLDGWLAARLRSDHLRADNQADILDVSPLALVRHCTPKQRFSDHSRIWWIAGLAHTSRLRWNTIWILLFLQMLLNNWKHSMYPKCKKSKAGKSFPIFGKSQTFPNNNNIDTISIFLDITIGGRLNTPSAVQCVRRLAP